MTPLEHVVAVGQILDSLDVRSVLGGSLASSIVGEPRSTVDIDIAVGLSAARVDDLVDAVALDYYVDKSMAVDAVADHSSFNLIHSRTGMEVDLFALGDDLLDVRQLERRQRVMIDDNTSIGSVPPTIRFFASCVGTGWVATPRTGNGATCSRYSGCKALESMHLLSSRPPVRSV